ncbi:uncharacterized protein At5g65660-like [Prosopis cineraria]|uniref:uncharacterized protein At5g65660-like n=1 Tax=Prosopis cineraria TaxID=364024 RepID=UPI00240FB8A0|nr:uncharacterized protein At5g65660-like [Prosopis cineraria]
MEVEDAASRVSVGFPLSLGLLFALLLLLCGVLCCCLQWDKFRALLPCSGFLNALLGPDSASYHPPQKPELPFVVTKKMEIESSPVLMPGDEVPKFIAMACPCQPPKEEKITIQVHQAT